MLQEKTTEKIANKLTKTNKVTFFEQEKVKKTLVFGNWTNTYYDVVEDPLPSSTYDETYADSIAKGLDPRLNSDTLTYGVARTLSPKTAMINKMKADIDAANAKLRGFMTEQQKIILEQQAKQAAAKQEPKKEANNDK